MTLGDKVVKKIEGELHHLSHNLAHDIDQFFWNEIPTEEEYDEIIEKVLTRIKHKLKANL